jgi:hypothetical protein
MHYSLVGALLFTWVQLKQLLPTQSQALCVATTTDPSAELSLRLENPETLDWGILALFSEVTKGWTPNILLCI